MHGLFASAWPGFCEGGVMRSRSVGPGTEAPVLYDCQWAPRDLVALAEQWPSNSVEPTGSSFRIDTTCVLLNFDWRIRTAWLGWLFCQNSSPSDLSLFQGAYGIDFCECGGSCEKSMWLTIRQFT